MMTQKKAAQPPKPVKLPRGYCGSCGRTWIIRVEKPAKCPKCFSTHVRVE